MTANGTARIRDCEKRERMEQIERILRRLSPELTDSKLDELIVRFWQRSGFGDG